MLAAKFALIATGESLINATYVRSSQPRSGWAMWPKWAQTRRLPFLVRR